MDLLQAASSHDRVAFSLRAGRGLELARCDQSPVIFIVCVAFSLRAGRGLELNKCKMFMVNGHVAFSLRAGRGLEHL